MIMVVQFLHSKNDDYRQETLHLAGSIADRYLKHLANKGKKAPSLVILATTAILIAAKIEQPISPSFNRMISLLPEPLKRYVRKRDLLDLEK